MIHFLTILQQSPITIMFLSAWLLSILVGTYYFARQCVDKNYFWAIGMQSAGQWLVILTTLSHKGFEHGWLVHMIAGAQGGAFLFFGVGNILMIRGFLKNV